MELSVFEMSCGDKPANNPILAPLHAAEVGCSCVCVFPLFLGGVFVWGQRVLVCRFGLGTCCQSV